MKLVILKSNAPDGRVAGTIISITKTNILSSREREIYIVETIALPLPLEELFHLLLRGNLIRFQNKKIVTQDGIPVKLQAYIARDKFVPVDELTVARRFDPTYPADANLCLPIYNAYFPDKSYDDEDNWGDFRRYWLEKWYSLIEEPDVLQVFWAYAYGTFADVADTVPNLSPETKTKVIASTVFTAQDKTYLANIGVV